MPGREITPSEETALAAYNALGTPDHIRSKIRGLQRENQGFRTKITELEKVNTDTPKVPDGGRVITKDEATELEAFRALKLKPAELVTTLKETETLKTKLTMQEREAGRDKAAKVLGLEGKDLLPFSGADQLEYSVEQEEMEENGAKVKKDVAYVTGTDKKKTKLVDFGKEKWGRPFENLLSAPTPPSTPGLTWPPQSTTPPRDGGKLSDSDYTKRVTDATVQYSI